MSIANKCDELKRALDEVRRIADSIGNLTGDAKDAFGECFIGNEYAAALQRLTEAINAAEAERLKLAGYPDEEALRKEYKKLMRLRALLASREYHILTLMKALHVGNGALESTVYGMSADSVMSGYNRLKESLSSKAISKNAFKEAVWLRKQTVRQAVKPMRAPNEIHANVRVGSTVSFGHYPQTPWGTDSTPIEWIVLDVQGNKVLLLSQYGLDAQPYNKDFKKVDWEGCTLRTWLNSTFLNKAFSADEQRVILTTCVDNSKPQCYSKWNTSGGNNTQDKIFLLSYAEANKYFGVSHNDNNTKSRVEPTAYAIKNRAFTDSSFKTADGKSVGWWWLRSPGLHQSFAAYVLANGSLDYCNVRNVDECVRPAFWINLESDIFKS